MPAARKAEAAINPRQLTAFKQQLRSIVDAQTRRLEALLAEHEAEEDGEDGETDDQAAFDDSPEGERLHRYQSYWSRSLLRTLDALEKLRKQRTVNASDPEEGPDTTEDATEAPEPVVGTEVRAEAAAEGGMTGVVGPLAQRHPISDFPTAPPIAQSETGRENRLPLHPDAPGSPACPMESYSQQESAKQSHRQAAPTEPIISPGEQNGSSDLGRYRGCDFKT